ncbi:hypothetical protein [Nostoc sp. PA-18-2419]|uniref:hypothetical protein n=1 Tax=Nostoc sp. PA-18-2419 TaxID=2575443 RepID=UPI001108BE69|nr:hypothetical protein [Nostoc sp. PA-18-2419]
MNSQNIVEYEEYSIQIGRTLVDKMTGEQYWTVSIGQPGQPQLPVQKQYGGYEVALAEARSLH